MTRVDESRPTGRTGFFRRNVGQPRGEAKSFGQETPNGALSVGRERRFEGLGENCRWLFPLFTTFFGRGCLREVRCGVRWGFRRGFLRGVFWQFGRRGVRFIDRVGSKFFRGNASDVRPSAVSLFGLHLTSFAPPGISYIIVETTVLESWAFSVSKSPPEWTDGAQGAQCGNNFSKGRTNIVGATFRLSIFLYNVAFLVG